MRASSPAADLGGRTALLLLSLAPETGRSLFILTSTEGVVHTRGDGQHTARRVRFAAGSFPFVSESFDSVVIDVQRPRLKRALRLRVLREANRILRPKGRCILVTSYRRIPRGRRSFRDYCLVPSGPGWMRLLAACDQFQMVCSSYARLDQTRLVELLFGNTESPRTAAAADRRISVLCRSPRQSVPALLDIVFSELNRTTIASRGDVRLERLLIRRIGKTTLFAASADGCKYLIRLPRSPIADERARRNFAALGAFHEAAAVPADLKALVPEPRLSGSAGGYRFYVEDRRPGTARDDYVGWAPGLGWESEALHFISEMHLATRRIVRFDRNEFDARITALMSRIRSHVLPDTRAEAALDRIAAGLEKFLIGTTLPLVWAHGDFASGNCLYDGARKLTAVVDWELSSDCHLPLLDLLHSMEIPDERNSHSTWQRFDTIYSMLQRDSWMTMPALASYINQMKIPESVLPALAVVYWIDHVANRIDARADDATWMQKRVLRPLAALASTNVV